MQRKNLLFRSFIDVNRLPFFSSLLLIVAVLVDSDCFRRLFAGKMLNRIQYRTNRSHAHSLQKKKKVNKFEFITR